MGANEIGKLANKNSRDKGFWDEYDLIDSLPIDDRFKQALKEAEIAKKLMLTVSELGEAMEARRKNKFCILDTPYKLTAKGCGVPVRFFEENIKDTFEDELADSYIRIVELAAEFKIDLDFHIEKKMMYNQTRPAKHNKIY